MKKWLVIVGEDHKEFVDADSWRVDVDTAVPGGAALAQLTFLQGGEEKQHVVAVFSRNVVSYWREVED